MSVPLSDAFVWSKSNGGVINKGKKIISSKQVENFDFCSLMYQSALFYLYKALRVPIIIIINYYFFCIKQ